jgi:hypothetical protein
MGRQRNLYWFENFVLNFISEVLKYNFHNYFLFIKIATLEALWIGILLCKIFIDVMLTGQVNVQPSLLRV